MKPLSILFAIMEGIYRIGSTAHPQDAFMAHQCGDGFVIVSRNIQPKPNFAVAVSIALLRLVTNKQGLAKVGLSWGDFSDIQGCWPEIIRNNVCNCHVSFGEERGFMRVFPVMGSAFINAHNLTTSCSGSLLLVSKDADMLAHLPPTVTRTDCPNTDNCVAIDWVHSTLPELHLIASELQRIASQSYDCVPSPREVESQIGQYIQDAGQSLPRPWIEHTLALNRCEHGQANSPPLVTDGG